MPEEPWRRAYELSRLQEQGGREPKRRGSHGPWGPLLVVLLVAALLIAGVYFWRERIARKLQPRVQDVVEALPEPLRPRAEPVSLNALDEGLGVNLRLTGPYSVLVEATREWAVEWQFHATGERYLRMSAPGVSVSTVGGLIQTYEIDIVEVFNSDLWEPWVPHLTAAGIHPNSTFSEATGESGPGGAQHYLYSETGWVQFDGTRVKPIYDLRFAAGLLDRIKGGLEIQP